MRRGATMNKANQKLFKKNKDQAKSDKRLLIGEIVLGSTTTISFFVVLCVSLYEIFEHNVYVWPAIMISVGFVVFLTGILFCIYIEQKVGYYVCGKCKHKFKPTFKQVLFSMHICRTRHIKCPKCNIKTWCKKVVE